MSLYSIISLTFFITLAFTSSEIQIAIPLSPPISNSPRHIQLSGLAAASLATARRQNPPSASTPLLSHSYGGYSISLQFGTPPQTVPLIMDTGSDLVWFPCTRHYLCRNCNTTIDPFIPKSSSSSRILGCSNPKCGWVHASGNRVNCTTCPPYVILYGAGATAGVLLTETLDLPGKMIADFVVGCSISSTRQPAGIAGFGRGKDSLPSQLGLTKFSYCLLSRRFDDTPTSSSLLLDWTGKKPPGMSYTPLLHNPSFSTYYYVNLRRITVGSQRVKIHAPSLSTVVDSGTTFTFMETDVFEELARLMEEQMGKPRSPEIELLTGLPRCYNVSGVETTSFPEMKFHFKGGAEMKLPVENYFAAVEDAGVVCLAIISGDGDISGGPRIILGSFQFQNFQVVYDISKQRFGMTRRECGKE